MSDIESNHRRFFWSDALHIPISRSSCLLLIAFGVGVILLLSSDFGSSWDITVHEGAGAKAYQFYFQGFDSLEFKRDNPSVYYGVLTDVVIKLVQDLTSNPLQKFEIRVFLQALITFSCLIPTFLICARVVPNGLALIGAALLASTPVFFGHAFINPKDSLAASGVVWCLWLVLYCFANRDRPRYGAIIVLGLLLGVTTSLRYIAGYLLLLVPLIALFLSAQPQWHSTPHFFWRVGHQAGLEVRGLALLILCFVSAYTLSMPSILADFAAQSYLAVMHSFAHAGWSGSILYFGHYVEAQHLPWHYVYGYLFVQLPLYFHFFLLFFLALCAARPARLREVVSGLNTSERTTLFALAVSVFLPLLLIFVVRPVFYDGFRHVLFLVPLILMLLYLSFVLALNAFGSITQKLVVAMAILCWMQALLAMRDLHPYEYAYYNPLVSPAGEFELDYWASSFRELAGELNDYARRQVPRGEKLRLAVCGPTPPLTLFLDHDKFELVSEGQAQLMVSLNRDKCMSFFRGPWLFSIERKNLVFSLVARP
jgi:4-amino-4-deoxy-L-arabinose transferase-like glycosyltransferase